MRRIKPGQRQRGAVALTVAILMVSLVGFTAISVDVGTLWMDRKELQNGADAAALALAQSCAEGACEADEASMAANYAEGNKRDANVTVTDITPDIASRTTSVTVTVESERQHWFAPVIGHDSSVVGATATASWGGIGSAWVAPFTVSLCHLDDIEDGTPDLQLFLKDEENDCTAGNPPHAMPGGMDWLLTTNEACTVETDIDGWAPNDPGNDGTKNSYCDDLLSNMVGEELLIPVFDDVRGVGSGSEYHIDGYAVLQVDDYCLNKGAGWYGGIGKCTGASRWITGTFIEKVALGSEIGGPNYGATTVALTD